MWKAIKSLMHLIHNDVIIDSYTPTHRIRKKNKFQFHIVVTLGHFRRWARLKKTNFLTLNERKMLEVSQQDSFSKKPILFQCFFDDSFGFSYAVLCTDRKMVWNCYHQELLSFADPTMYHVYEFENGLIFGFCDLYNELVCKS